MKGAINKLKQKAKKSLRYLLLALNRISVRLYFGIGGAVALTMLTSLIALASFIRIGDAQMRVSEYVPNMVTAFSLAQQGNALASAAPKLAAAATPADFERVRAEIAQEKAIFEEKLGEVMQQRDEGEGVGGIRQGAQALIANILSIEDSMEKRFILDELSEARQAGVVALQQTLEKQLLEAIDDQFFYTATGSRDGQTTDKGAAFSETELHRFRYLMELQQANNLGTQVLGSIANVSDPVQLEPLRERFETVAELVNRSLTGLEDASLLTASLRQGIDQLVKMGVGEDTTFDLRQELLELVVSIQQDLLANRQLTSDLLKVIEQTVNEARVRSLSATDAVAEAILTATTLLLSVNVVSIIGAVIFGWFFVGTLVARINWLSDRMRSMAEGELEAEVDTSGRDEVAAMAAALEVFRRSSLEAQRLNLVEQLAEELRGKNEELEGVLQQLQHAQDQIVMREKLAALGELTAGVAHEIKNPLNFVKNFAEGSVELIDELNSLIAKAKEGGLDEEQREQLVDLGADLNENLASILRNGERANRIVQDMLGMGRDAGDFMHTDINALLLEHTKLAYHAARASDPDFQLDIKEDLDPEAGELNIIPHDMGRVFLNMVGNACYATDEKRKQAVAAGERFSPRVEIGTRKEAAKVVVTIRDNGLGIPKEMVADIFNPFFTTKPPDKGTGLGLSLSNDIVVEHGGAIKVDSEPGEFTEMRVELPLNFKAQARNGAQEAGEPSGGE